MPRVYNLPVKGAFTVFLCDGKALADYELDPIGCVAPSTGQLHVGHECIHKSKLETHIIRRINLLMPWMYKTNQNFIILTKEVEWTKYLPDHINVAMCTAAATTNYPNAHFQKYLDRFVKLKAFW